MSLLEVKREICLKVNARFGGTLAKLMIWLLNGFTSFINQTFMLTFCFIFKMGHSAQDGGLSMCQGGVAAKMQMALIELEVVCKA